MCETAPSALSRHIEKRRHRVGRRPCTPCMTDRRRRHLKGAPRRVKSVHPHGQHVVLDFIQPYGEQAVLMQYNRARGYDAGTGRWLCEDPVGFAGDASNPEWSGQRIAWCNGSESAWSCKRKGLQKRKPSISPPILFASRSTSRVDIRPVPFIRLKKGHAMRCLSLERQNDPCPL